MSMNAHQLINSIRDVFLHQDKYLMKKYAPEFFNGEEFVGDYFNNITFELLGNLPPRVYYTGGPFDLISQKAPEQALVFHNGNLELNLDFTEFCMMRTGVMDSLVLQALGIKDVSDKRIIMFGSGNIARWSLKYLKEVYPSVKDIDIVNRSGGSENFTQFASELGITTTFQKEPHLELYDIIILHTSSVSGVLGAEDVSKIKKGAIITTYKALHEHGELASEFYDTKKNNIIIDWPEALHAGDLKAAQEKGLLQENNVLHLADVLQGEKHLLERNFTIFRSDGTPMQDVAILKLILKELNNTHK